MTDLERECIDLISQIRQNPQDFVARFEERKSWFEGKTMRRPGAIGLITNEGAPAVQEAIDFLKVQPPLNPVAYGEEMQGIATDHATYLGSTGTLSHQGPDGSSSGDRIKSVVDCNLRAENIYCGPDYGSAEEIVFSLIIDDGVPERGH